MGKHHRRTQAERLARMLGQSYREALLLRRRLQYLVERVDTAHEGWLELVAGVEEVEFRLRCVLRVYEDVFSSAPGPSGDGGATKKISDC